MTKALTKPEKKVLAHLRNGWKAVINRRTFYVTFVRNWSDIWVPKGPTGATIASLMRKERIDFDGTKTICGLKEVAK